MKISLKRGEILIGTFVLEFGGSAIATLLASAGADFIIADLEHSSFSIETVGRIIRNARGSNLPCIVRVPALERHFVSRVLDAGATGVMIPRVESHEDIEKIKRWTKYAPEGDRGVAFGIGHTDYGDFTKLDTRGYVRNANQEILTIGQIETVKAVENLDDILSTGELDVVFVGPYDLSTSMGISGELDHPQLLEAIKKIIRHAQTHNIPLGCYVNDFESGEQWLRSGVQLIACGNDAFLLTRKFAEEHQKFKNAANLK
ncbi:aldolase [Candidatus Poribacteria bacterium]|nr:MAG: aldolase [Candidatus Poribacteria bacterium]